MKTCINLFVSLSILVLLYSGCEESTTHIPDNNPLVFSGQLTDNTECKMLKSTLTISETSDTLSCIEYSFNENKNKLSITHINAAFNCCPDNLYCNISLDEDTIIIEEFEKEALCKCNCLYDLNIELEGIDSKTYNLKIVEPYLFGEEKLNIELDLAFAPEAKHCVTRKNYPWGMSLYL